MVRAMLTVEQRRELEARVRSRNLRAGDVRKARLVLMLAEGFSYRAVEDALGCSSAYVARWKTRFEAEGLAGLYGRHQGRRATVLTPAVGARILGKKREPAT